MTPLYGNALTTHTTLTVTYERAEKRKEKMTGKLITTTIGRRVFITRVKLTVTELIVKPIATLIRRYLPREISNTTSNDEAEERSRTGY